MMRSTSRMVRLQGALARRGYATRGKDIQFGQDAREHMLRGVENLTKAVAVTMGPSGRNVIIEQSYGGPKISKDGVTVAKSIEFADRYENLGAQLVRQVANTTNDIAGDGTTTATVLACSIFREGFKCVTTGANPTDIKRGIDLAVRHVVQNLNSMAKRIATNDDIRNVATISANGDKEVGKLLADALARLGPNGTITTQDGKTLTTEIEVVEGMSIDRGYISPHFVNNTKQQKVEFDDAFVLVHQKKISNINTILPVLNHVAQQNKPLLIIADDVDGEALSTLIINKTMGKIRVVAVKAPSFGDEKNNYLMDIAIMTGAQFISEEVGLTLDQNNFDPACLGTIQKVTVSKDSTILLGGAGSKDAVKERVELLNSMLEHETSDYKREKIQERLSKLSGGVAVIKVGGASDVEVNEKKDRITDALCATRAAIEEGILPGGGVALLRASHALGSLGMEGLTEDQRIGVHIVKQAIRLPARTIAENAGLEGSVIVEKILEHKDANIGYDAVTHQYRNMIEAGILDPLKVVKSALVDASSVASLMLTTEAAVVESAEEEDA